MPADEELIGQNEVDVRNEARRPAAEWPEANHAGTRYEGPRFEVSPRERDDEARRDEREFGTAELKQEDEDGTRHLRGDMGQPEGWIDE